MTAERLPLLRGRISRIDTYRSPQGGGGGTHWLPSLDPAAHQARLIQQLDTIDREVQERTTAARDQLATREIIAVHPVQGAELAPEQLDDARADVRLIGTDPDTGTVLLDVANSHLDHLRKKIEAFADDSKIKRKRLDDGTEVVKRAREDAIAPIDTVNLARVTDVQGLRLRAETLVVDRSYWFEITCRGGYRQPQPATDESRAQIKRQTARVGAEQKIDEFIGPEQVYFFVRLTRKQLQELQAATDCIYEVELAPPSLRDLKLLDDVTTSDVQNFSLRPPHPSAPAVVILDTGIATRHPLLQQAILTKTTAGPEIPSPEDTHGHGTKMAGMALYQDLGAAIEHGSAAATHWLQSSRLLVTPGLGTAADESHESWPVLTLGAVLSAEGADPGPRDRVFALAVTRSMQDKPDELPTPTLWSHAVDQIAYHEGQGRLMVVAAGNARDEKWLGLAELYPQLQLTEHIHQPAQAVNALTVGAFTSRVELPKDKEFAEAVVVAKEAGGISPFTSCGLPGNEWPVKPDIVMEGGNLALSGQLTDGSVPTLTGLTTSNRHHLGSPLGQISMTSEAAARAARLAARIWVAEPKLRPETVRGLIVHSANWTPAMLRQFSGISDRLHACGYGVPDEHMACECSRDLATVIIEDVMPNAVMEEEPRKSAPVRPTTKTTETKARRKVKLYRLPIPDELLDRPDEDVELRVTLSYFAEPNRFGRRTFHGLDAKWDMQGPQETEGQFLERMNQLMRPVSSDGRRKRVLSTNSFNWEIGIQSRSRGTVQSDRWRGKMAALAGDKLIAIIPVLGWWDQRKNLRDLAMNFSLVISVRGPGVYEVIKPRVEMQVETEVTV
ncbi:MAG: S8 family peptidase [Candidatus Geothermincolia bacterium]